MALKPIQKEISSDQPEAVAMSVTIENQVLKHYSEPVNPWDVPVELPLPDDEDLLIRAFGDLPNFLEINLDTNQTAQAVKTQVSQAQWDALVAYQVAEKDKDRDEKIEKLLVALGKLIYQLGENGLSCTAANLKPWRDQVKVVLGL